MEILSIFQTMQDRQYNEQNNPQLFSKPSESVDEQPREEMGAGRSMVYLRDNE